MVLHDVLKLHFVTHEFWRHTH